MMNNLYRNAIVFLFLLTLLTSCGKIEHSKVTAARGLVLRESPSANSKKLSTIPYNTNVIILDKSGPLETINSRKAPWVKVTYEDDQGWTFKGWVFSGYLDIYKTDNSLPVKYTRTAFTLPRKWTQYTEAGFGSTLLFNNKKGTLTNAPWDEGKTFPIEKGSFHVEVSKDKYFVFMKVNGKKIRYRLLVPGKKKSYADLHSSDSDQLKHAYSTDKNNKSIKVMDGDGTLKKMVMMLQDNDTDQHGIGILFLSR